MGRCFSTVYRFILVVVSVCALTLSILSATSCAFVKFDHQYKSSLRSLLDGENRGLQGDTPTEGAVADAADGTPTDGTPADGTPAEGTTPVDGTTVVDGTAADGTPADTTGAIPAEGPGVMADVASPAEALIDAATTPAVVPTETAPAEAPVTSPTPILGETQGTTTAAGSPEIAESVPATITTPVITVPDSSGPDLTAPTPTTTDPTGDIPMGGDPMSGDGDTSASESSLYPDDPSDSAFQYNGEVGEYKDGGDAAGASGAGSSEADSGAFGASSSEADSAASAAEEEPAAQVSGDAGLFCDGARDFSITNLWHGSISDLEESISEDSDNNQSEDLARNAVIAATIFGTVAMALLLFESIVGWRMCCDRWIIGLISMMACISQGVTFLFFNSERYCDGDIIHEILNQEPCVVGQGAEMAIGALVLYFIMMIMCCRLPQDDPYGLCCKKDNSSTTSGGASTSSSGKFGLLGGKSDTSVTDGTSDQKPERPNWLSEDKKKEADEENEII